MLFLAKRDAKSSLIGAALMALAAFAAYSTLDLSWRPPASVWHFVGDGLFGLAMLLASDASLHTMFSSLASDRYPSAFLGLAEVFAEQTPSDWLAGGVLAGAEELLFRGVLVTGGIQVVGLGPIAAAALAALAFGLAHLLVARRLWAFSIWATWEGFLLGLLYLASGSLGAVILAHGLHDVLGFWFFQRSLKRAQF
jgi:membrane protease YdiL (CAAX protease family)